MTQANSYALTETPPDLYAVHDSIPYGEAKRIRTCDTLDEDAIVEGATANYRYSETADEDVLAVRPESMASSMHLGSMTMVAISLDAVPTALLAEVDADTDVDLATYSVLVFGNPPRNPNHSIQEYL